MSRSTLSIWLVAGANLLLLAGCQPGAGEGTAAAPTAASVVDPAPTVTAVAPTPSAGASSDPLLVTGLAEGDRAELSADSDVIYLDLYSAEGIGQAYVALAEGVSPGSIIVRLHLTGLEEIRFQYGTIAIIASVASSEGHAVRQSVENSLAMRPAPEAIDSDSPYWLEIAIRGDDPAAPFPLEDGFFEVQAPADFLAGDHPGFSLRWIDFFR